MGQERFRIRPPDVDEHGGYDTPDFPRWRTELFAQVEVAQIVDYLRPYLTGEHSFDHIGLSACCKCGWKEREFTSTVAAKCAWWEHAEPLIDWSAVEDERVLEALGKLGR